MANDKYTPQTEFKLAKKGRGASSLIYNDAVINEFLVACLPLV
jgi:hypothetical protein